LSGADFTDSGGSITIEPGQAQKVQNLSVEDDGVIERTENGTIILSGASSTGDAVHILTPWTFTSVVDNEWRWIGTAEQISYSSNTVAIDAHWYPDASFLNGSMEVESANVGGMSIEGPNTLIATVDGHFHDDSLGSPEDYSATNQLTMTFICDKTYGTISHAPGPTSGPGNGSSGALTTELAAGTPQVVSNPSESIVTVDFAGDAAVGGSLEVTTTVSLFGVGIEFTPNGGWGDHAGSPFAAVGALTCRKGSE
jgi:hypothetical protein